MTRHLLYHVYPVSGNGVWQRNVFELRQRLRLFDGHKTVAIMTGEGLDHPSFVMARLPECEFIELPNDPKLREVKSWGPLWWSLMPHVYADDVVFYAHTKGVTRPDDPNIRAWTRIMYESLLDYWPVVEEILSRRLIAGSFKCLGRGFAESKSTWHYAGGFYWARVDAALFNDSWRNIDRIWYGSESWPGISYSPEQAGCVFHDGQMGDLDFATIEQHGPWVEWQKANESRRTNPTLGS